MRNKKVTVWQQALEKRLKSYVSSRFYFEFVQGIKESPIKNRSQVSTKSQFGPILLCLSILRYSKQPQFTVPAVPHRTGAKQEYLL